MYHKYSRRVNRFRAPHLEYTCRKLNMCKLTERNIKKHNEQTQQTQCCDHKIIAIKLWHTWEKINGPISQGFHHQWPKAPHLQWYCGWEESHIWHYLQNFLKDLWKECIEANKKDEWWEHSISGIPIKHLHAYIISSKIGNMNISQNPFQILF